MLAGMTAADRSAREACAQAGLAALLAALLLYLGPPGTDFAAHAYQEALYAAHGFSLWNNLWYSGRYSFVTYSVLYYPVAKVVGIRVLAVVCAVVGVAAFRSLTNRRWGPAARWSNRSMAIVLPCFVLTAAFPFLLGATVGLLALIALDARRWRTFAALSALAAASSPLAFLLLGVVVLGFAAADRWSGATLVRGVSILSGIAALLIAVTKVFASKSSDPFATSSFLVALAFSLGLAALTWRVESARPLRFGALFNAAACSGAFVLSTNIGEGVTRLRYLALPIAVLALSLRRWRPLGVSVLVLLLVGYWNVTPLVSSFATGVTDPSSQASYWRPATAYLKAHLDPSYRVEVVDTAHHSAAAYLPDAGIPLVRGWFRQDDFPQNQLLYGELTPARYVRWLHQLGVGYVVLPDVAPDYSAEREAALLRGGRAGLEVVYRTAHLQVLRVPSPQPIVSGPGHPRLTALGREGMTVWLGAAGSYRIAVRYSPYWRSTSGCLRSTHDGMLGLVTTGPGVVRIAFRVSVPTMLRVIAAEEQPACAVG
jgi:hypothetical protein